jgi:septal ring factor EnvC (AmiA/AmiB activator)
MIDVSVVQVVTVLLLTVNTIVAAAAFVRVGKWRNSDDGKKVRDDIARLQSEIATDGGSTVKADIHKLKNEQMKIEGRLAAVEKTGDKTSDKVDAIATQVTSIETSMKHMASRADIERMAGEIGGIEQITRNTESAVVRIESWLMERTGS